MMETFRVGDGKTQIWEAESFDDHLNDLARSIEENKRQVFWPFAEILQRAADELAEALSQLDLEDDAD